MKKRVLSVMLAAVLAGMLALPAAAETTSLNAKGWSYVSVKDENGKSTAWIYGDGSGSYVSGLQEIDGYTYYFKPCTYTDPQGRSIELGGILGRETGKITNGYYQMEDYRTAIDHWIYDYNNKRGWAYFGPDGKQVVGEQTIDGEQYDFGENGFLAEENAPFPNIEIASITLGEYEGTAVAGDGNTVEIPFEIMVKTYEKASPSDAVKVVEKEADYDIFKKAYDVNQSYRLRLPSGPMLAEAETKFAVDWDRQVLQVPVTESGWAYGTLTIRAKNGSIKAEDGFSIVCLGDESEDPEKTAEDILSTLLSGWKAQNFDPDILKRSLEYANNNGALKSALENLKDRDSLSDLERTYAAEKGIKVSAGIDPAAAELLTGNSVKTVGLGLAAEESASMELKVTLSSETVPEAFQNRTDVVPLDLSVYQDGEKITERLSVPVIITLPIPKGMTAVDIYHIHDGKQEKVNCSYSGNTVTFVADEYSMYLLVEKKTENSSTGGTSTGGTSTGGTSTGSTSTGSASSESSAGSAAGQQKGAWQQDETGWWYRNPDGTYPVGVWQYLVYNGRYDWYHFNEQGYMQTGWFTDTDGRQYYLNPVSDGTQGAMVTGWKQIGDDWYYFNEVSDGHKGALYVDTVTPDGCRTDSKGRWIS